MSEFDKYKKYGSVHWEEMMTCDIRKFNAHHQARYNWILKKCGEMVGKKVLDLGCGDGALTFLLAKNQADVVGLDNEPLGVSFAREQLAKYDSQKKLKYEIREASVYKIPFADDFFDIIVNCEVIEHLENPEAMLKEAKRVLKKSGKFILSTPYRLTEVSSDHTHVHEYFPEELKKLLSNYFEQVEIKLTHHIFWFGLYNYYSRAFGGRKLGRWFINMLAIWFKWNPFMIEYSDSYRKNIFSQILAICSR